FWRSRDASDTDKLAAYQTLYEVLVTLSKLLAPCVPFICERMYDNLVVKGVGLPATKELEHWMQSAFADSDDFDQYSETMRQLRRLGIMRETNVSPSGSKPLNMSYFADVPASVHLCPYPTADDRILDPELNERMALAQL